MVLGVRRSNVPASLFHFNFLLSKSKPFYACILTVCLTSIIPDIAIVVLTSWHVIQCIIIDSPRDAGVIRRTKRPPGR